MLNSPFRLTALMLTCSLVAVACFLSIGISAVRTHPLLMIPCIMGVVVAFLGMLWSSSLLRNNVRNERWPAETLAPFHRVIDHVLWKIGLGLLFVALIAALMLQGRHHTPWFWAVFFLLQAQTQMTNAFARPRTPPATGALLDWSKLSPLHSDHWGER